MQQQEPPFGPATRFPAAGMTSQFIHQGYLQRRMLLGWRKHYCILRGRSMELYRVKGDAKPKDMTPTRVLIIEHFYADFRLPDQFDVILPRGGKKTFKLDPDQIKCGERSLWVQALQTALLCDNALERYGEDITKQLMTYASKQVSEFGSLRLDDSMWKTLRKRSIHGDLWSRFQELVTKGIELAEVVPPPAVGLRYLFCMDMGSSAAAPRQIRLVPMVPINNEGTDNSKNELENGVVDPVVRHIDLQHIVSVTDCSSGRATDAAVRLRRFTLTHVVENEPVVEVFETASTDLRSRLVFGLAYILKNYNAAKQQHSPRQLRLRRLSPPTTSSSPGLPTMTTREERASASQVSTTSSLDVLGGVSNQHVDAAIRSFNVRPKNGIAIAVDLGVIDNENPTATAEFLRHTKGLDKDKVGEYLGGDDAFSVHVLLAYAMCFAWEGKPFEVCLRDFLSKFRLPGESQKIDRMMEAFAKAFHAKNPHVFQHHDAAHILAFSTIMLNTDLHNKCMTNRNRMTKSQFVHNNRGIDKDKSDIPHAILEGIFDSIKKQAVVTVRDRDDNGNLFANPDMAGWLKTYRRSGIKTRRRWFMLTNHCLYFFDRQEDIDPLGFYALENVKVQCITGRPLGFELRAAVANSSVKSALYPKQRARKAKGGLAMRPLQRVGFAAESAGEAKAWVAVLEKFILLHETNASQLVKKGPAIPPPMLASQSFRLRGSTSTSFEDTDEGQRM